MSALSEQILIFAVMSALVALFTWIYLRDPQREFGFWLLGWSAIFVHTSVAGHFLPLPGSVIEWISVTTLIMAGTFFLLAVSEVFRNPRERLIFVLAIGVASTLYLTGMILQFHGPWFYVVLLSTSIVSTLIQGARYYGFKSLYFYTMFTLLVPYSLWADWQAGTGRLEYGRDFYFFVFFGFTAMAYFRRFRRLTPGVVFTSISFLAWGAVFPVSTLLQAYGVTPVGFIWDLPKYAVAFGMILTLFENQTAVATTAAKQYQSLLERNMAGVFVSTFEGKLLDCNTSFVKMYGFDSKEDALATPCVALYVEASEREAFVKELDTQGQALNYELRQRRKDGSVFWTLGRVTTMVDVNGRRLIEGTTIDITERKHAELELRQSEERFATIFRESPIGCMILTPDSVFLDANDAMLRVLARPAEAVVGKNAVELGLCKSQQESDHFYATLRAEGSVHGMEVAFNDAEGMRHEGLYSATLVRIADHQCIFGMMLELTEKRELEAKFLQAQKMEALGRLAGGVAHDFNNLLGVIGGYAELLAAKLGHNENYRRYCAKILDTTQRLSELTQPLLTFSRKEITLPMPIQPDQVLRDLAGILPRLIGEDKELVLDLRASGTILMGKTRFEQIVINVAGNARDAMPNGGQLFIETEDAHRPMFHASGSVGQRHYVAIRFRDTGVGMDEETRRHALEPFYTTKGVGRGTGLGLSTVYGIVQQSNGEITIESELGKGTQINILIPALDEIPRDRKDALRQEIKKGAGNILLVEDEAELRNVNAEFLSSIGYSVICASSGPEALELAREAGPIDLVISDVVMPKMSGREFADSLRQVRPDIKLLFVSGYADDVVLQTGLSTEAMPFLQKPFSLKQLGAKINEILSVRARKNGYGSSRASSAG